MDKSIIGIYQQYLTNKKNLDNHLLKGLSTTRVPNNCKDSIYTFEYNNFEQLIKLVNKNIKSVKRIFGSIEIIFT